MACMIFGEDRGVLDEYWRIGFGAWNKTVPHFASDWQNRCRLYLICYFYLASSILVGSPPEDAES